MKVVGKGGILEARDLAPPKGHKSTMDPAKREVRAIGFPRFVPTGRSCALLLKQSEAGSNAATLSSPPFAHLPRAALARALDHLVDCT